MGILGLPDVYVPTESGHFVSQKHAQIAEIIKDYDPELELAWIPPNQLAPGDKPFAVIHRPVGKQSYIAFYADECDERILERIFSGDVRKQKQTILSQIDAKNAAVKAMQLKRRMDELDEANDIAKHVLKSPKTTYTADGVKYDTHAPAKRFAESKINPPE